MISFEFDGGKYLRASRHQKAWGRELVNQMVLAGDERVLDLGCGDGVLTFEIAAQLPGGSVLGIDASSSMIATAEKLKSDNLAFRIVDIDELNFESEFDIVFSNAALHWVHDHRKLAVNSVRALKPGGRLYWNFASAGTCAAFNGIVRELMAGAGYRRFFQNFIWPWNMPDADGYESNFAGLPLADLQIRNENRDRFFADECEMIRWLDQPSLVPFLAALPEAEKAPFRNAVVAAMIKACRRADGRCFEQFRRLNLTGVKV